MHAFEAAVKERQRTKKRQACTNVNKRNKNSAENNNSSPKSQAKCRDNNPKLARETHQHLLRPKCGAGCQVETRRATMQTCLQLPKEATRQASKCCRGRLGRQWSLKRHCGTRDKAKPASDHVNINQVDAAKALGRVRATEQSPRSNSVFFLPSMANRRTVRPL